MACLMHGEIDAILCVVNFLISFILISTVGFNEWYLDRLVSRRHLVQTIKTGKSHQKSLPLPPDSNELGLFCQQESFFGCRTACRVVFPCEI